MTQCVSCLYEQAKGVVVDDSRMNVEWAEEIGVTESSVRRHKSHAKLRAERAAEPTSPVETGTPGSSEFHDQNGSHYSEFSSEPWGYEDFCNFIRAKGQDPDKVTFNWGWTSNPGGGFWNKLNNVRPITQGKAALEAIDWDKASKFIEDFTFVPAKKQFLTEAAILQPTDEQYGKTDFDGGTPETEERVMQSYSGFVEYLREYRPREVLLARTGDGIENFCSTGSQRDTNDLDLPHMAVQLFKMDLAGLKLIAPEVERVIDARVPSNHGRWRTGPKADAGDPHADFGLGVGKQVAYACEATGFAPNVEFAFPDELMESMAVELGDTVVGMAHGHQVSNADRLSDWWMRQSHGRMPTWNADIMLFGHFHSFRAQQSGNKRWLFVGPASDNGSSWFSNIKGERSSSGMLAMCVSGGEWSNLEIL